MPSKPPSATGTRRQHRKAADQRRGSARERGYTWQWEKARTAFLAEPANQFCVKCKARGLLNPGTLHMDGRPETSARRIGLVVDHIIPHRGDQRLFWDPTNWQALCHDDHDQTKQLEERAALSDPHGVGPSKV